MCKKNIYCYYLKGVVPMGKIIRFLTVVVLLVVLSASSVLAGGVVKFGVELPGTIYFIFPVKDLPSEALIYDTKMGFSVGGEFFFDLGERLAVGVGADYQLNRKSERYETSLFYMEEEFKFIPLYALARCQIDSTYYVTGKVGYNLVEFQNYTAEYDFRGGLFYGFGGGVVLEDVFQVEVLYSVNNAKSTYQDDEDFECAIKYTKLGIALGYKF